MSCSLGICHTICGKPFPHLILNSWQQCQDRYRFYGLINTKEPYFSLIKNCMSNNVNGNTTVDVVLIGARIMSATLGMMLKELQPGITVEIFERLVMVSGESSDAWNNAGTGHAALCELNYTPQKEDGTIDRSKALAINEAFDNSRQF